MAGSTSLLPRAALVVAVLLATLGGAHEAAGQSTYVLVTGRRLPYLYGVSLDGALDPANDNTPNAIVSRAKVALERLDGRLLRAPATLIARAAGGSGGWATPPI